VGGGQAAATAAGADEGFCRKRNFIGAYSHSVTALLGVIALLRSLQVLSKGA
jgi:hypothetical protein